MIGFISRLWGNADYAALGIEASFIPNSWLMLCMPFPASLY